MARFDLTDAEWAAIEPVLRTDMRGKDRGGRPAGAERHLLAVAHGRALGRHPGALWSAHDVRQLLSALEQAWDLGSSS